MILGVDPGLRGGIVGLSDDGTRIMVAISLDQHLWTPKTAGLELAVESLRVELRNALEGYAAVASCERVGARSGQGVSSMFKFGKTTGALIGLLVGLGVPVVERTPPAWRALVGGLGKGKDASRARFCELWPSQSGLVRRKKDDGVAEAALIAEAYRRERNAR